MKKIIIITLIIIVVMSLALYLNFKYQVKLKERACLDSGGEVYQIYTCNKNFANICSQGPFGCFESAQHNAKLCDCGEGRCFNGSKCVNISPE